MIFWSFELLKSHTRKNIFMLITQGGHALQRI